MGIQKISNIFSVNDGSLPDIDFIYAGDHVVDKAYSVIQEHSHYLESTGAYYWSESEETEIPIKYGDNPAVIYLAGEAQGFHVVFGGVCSPSGKKVPALGVSVFFADRFTLDYRMGPEWNIEAVEGLFEILVLLENLSSKTKISVSGNQFDSEPSEILSQFEEWKTSNKAMQSTDLSGG